MAYFLLLIISFPSLTFADNAVKKFDVCESVKFEIECKDNYSNFCNNFRNTLEGEVDWLIHGEKLTEVIMSTYQDQVLICIDTIYKDSFKKITIENLNSPDFKFEDEKLENLEACGVKYMNEYFTNFCLKN